MRPIAVFRHAQCEGAGYFGYFLNQQQIPWQEVRIDLGHKIPSASHAFSGLVFMGGPMSVNDNLPWIPQAIRLIQHAYAQDVPVLGHCLGGQLMSKALGADITKNPVAEIGWGELHVQNNADASKWFGNTTDFLGFHWHSETFSLPEGATHLLSSKHCLNQAYAIGKHLAMQCHVEMTDNLVKQWYECWQSQVEASDSPAVQNKQEMLENLSVKIEQLNYYAHGLYSQWSMGLNV